MIRSIEVENFRCYKRLKLDGVNRLNIIVGDNGSGKSALLESVFFPIASTSQLVLRFRQHRGLDGSFHGSPRRIEEAIWASYFHNGEFLNPIRLTVTGDGIENRSLVIAQAPSPSGPGAASIGLLYTDSRGNKRTVLPTITTNNVSFPDTGEDLPDFFHFPANTTISSIENAGRFSDLSKARKQGEFVNIFVDEYKWLEDMNIEVIAGAPAIFGSLGRMENKIPLPDISGGINRMVSILVAIASRPKSIVLVDEIENGVYYKHQSAIWQGLLQVLRKYDGQMLATTHSKEWLEALVEAAGDRLDDIALWRIEPGPDGPEVLQFSGETLRAGIEHGTEVRSPSGSDA